MDNLGAIGGPLLAIGLLAVVSIRTAMFLSVIPGLLAAAIVYAIRRTATPRRRERQPVRVTVRPLLAGLGIGCGETAQSAAVAALTPGQFGGRRSGCWPRSRPAGT